VTNGGLPVRTERRWAPNRPPVPSRPGPPSPVSDRAPTGQGSIGTANAARWSLIVRPCQLPFGIRDNLGWLFAILAFAVLIGTVAESATHDISGNRQQHY